MLHIYSDTVGHTGFFPHIVAVTLLMDIKTKSRHQKQTNKYINTQSNHVLSITNVFSL